jgi:hypothetical protein
MTVCAASTPFDEITNTRNASVGKLNRLLLGNETVLPKRIEDEPDVLDMVFDRV